MSIDTVILAALLVTGCTNSCERRCTPEPVAIGDVIKIYEEPCEP